MQEDLQNLQTLLSALRKDHLGREEFLKEFERVLAFVKQLKNTNKQVISGAYERVNLLALRLKENNEQDIEKAKLEMTGLIEDYLAKVETATNQKMREVDEKVKELKNGIDGKDADEQAIADRVLREVQSPIIEKIEKNLPKLGEPIRDALELLDGDQRLDKSAIRGLDELLEKHNGQNIPYVGGIRYLSQLVDILIGSDLADGHAIVWDATNKRWKNGEVSGTSTINFADSETPTGDVDGANTDFVLAHTPETGSLKVYLNGMRMSLTEDYTLATATITFLTAPDSGSIITCDYRY
jgi:hypothetical protein